MSEIWLLVSAGQGPAECQWVVARLIDEVCAGAAAQGATARLVETTEGQQALPRSGLIRLEGQGACNFADAIAGTVQWIGTSTFRPKHKRRNWYVGVFPLPAPESVPQLRERDVTFQTMKASGPGGQHANKTDSAVRATHGPSGLVVVARAERSQHANKRLALVKIAAALARGETETTAAQDHERWQQHHNVERGNPVRIYEGPKFRRRGSA